MKGYAAAAQLPCAMHVMHKGTLQADSQPVIEKLTWHTISTFAAADAPSLVLALG
jgi:hypothetical protein